MDLALRVLGLISGETNRALKTLVTIAGADVILAGFEDGSGGSQQMDVNQ